jgi:hypothetical protein
MVADWRVLESSQQWARAFTSCCPVEHRQGTEPRPGLPSATAKPLNCLKFCLTVRFPFHEGAGKLTCGNSHHNILTPGGQCKNIVTHHDRVKHSYTRHKEVTGGWMSVWKNIRLLGANTWWMGTNKRMLGTATVSGGLRKIRWWEWRKRTKKVRNLERKKDS